MNQVQNKIFKLQGEVQSYHWGGSSFLPDLLNIPNPQNKPFAEYWLGAHGKASSTILLDDRKTAKLDEFIRSHGSLALGNDTAEKFGNLPYLLKILDVKDMLSIQVHPSKKNAEKEFEYENAKGIAIHAPQRNYRDNNHKPELIMAMSKFWLLHGFKPEEQMRFILERIPELRFLQAFFDNGYESLYRKVMQMEQVELNRRLEPLLNRIVPEYKNKNLQKDNEDFWAARAALTFNGPDKIDRGIFSIYLFNLVLLQPGEALYQSEGLPHAYLEGQNVEIMANSDNVLRGGLTLKHVDVNELMKQVLFEPTVPKIIRGRSIGKHLRTFITSAPDFELTEIGLKKNESITLESNSVEIFIVLTGRIVVHENVKNEFRRNRGQAWISLDKAESMLKAEEDCIVYRGAVPGHSGKIYE